MIFLRDSRVETSTRDLVRAQLADTPHLVAGECRFVTSSGWTFGSDVGRLLNSLPTGPASVNKQNVLFVFRRFELWNERLRACCWNRALVSGVELPSKGEGKSEPQQAVAQVGVQGFSTSDHPLFRGSDIKESACNAPRLLSESPSSPQLQLSSYLTFPPHRD